MLQKTKTLTVLFLCLMLSRFSVAQTISGFENISISSDSFLNGSDFSGGFASGNAFFVNNYDTSWGGSWSGFAASNKKDSVTPGYGNQYSAITGSGFRNSSNYLVGSAYGAVKVRLTGNAAGKALQGVYVSNSTYAYYSLRDGDGFAKKFGGVSGNDPDFFKLRVTGWYNGTAKSDTLEFFLADFTSSDNSKDYILKSWKWFDLRQLGNVDSIVFLLKSTDNGSFGMNTPAYFCLDHFVTRNHPLFDPGASHPATKAIHADSSVFKKWATGCVVNRGYKNIANTSAGLASVGDSTMALGKAGSNAIVSLGDGGSATLTFEFPIRNGAGPDFAVFENSFADNYLELAYVEVSSDGQNFFRFPSVSLTDTIQQLGGFDSLSPIDINNFAGKHRAMYGTPFDLEEMKNISGLNVNQVNYVRLVDVVGSVDSAYATRDSEGGVVNDPWPTEFASSGFDLDAVGVINYFFESVEEHNPAYFRIWPNPTGGILNLEMLHPAAEANITISDISGKTISSMDWSQQINISNLSAGVYFISVKTGTSSYSHKLVLIP